MREFILSRACMDDLERIDAYLERKDGLQAAIRVESKLFEAFGDLARLPALGHKRPETNSRGLLFYTVFSYVIIFRRKPELVIVRVIHGMRNLPKLLR